MASTRLGYIAMKAETGSSGTTIVPVKPTNFLRFKEGDVSYNQEVIKNNPIQNNRWGSIHAVKGKVNTSGTYRMDLDVNESVFWLYGALGAMATADISSATDASAFRHTITVANSLPMFTIEQGKGNLTDTSNHRQNYQIDRAFGVMVDTVRLSAADGLVEMEVGLKAHGVFQKANLLNNEAAGANVVMELEDVEGLTIADTVNISDLTPQSETDPVAAVNPAAKSITIATLSNSYTIANRAKVELVPQTPSLFSTQPRVLSFVHASFQFGADLTAAAAAEEENVENWEFSFMNNLMERYGSKRASPSVIAPRSAKATLKFTKYFENVTDRDRYRDLIRRAGIITLSNNEIISATDTGNSRYRVRIELSDVRFDTYEMPTGTDDLYAVKVEAECYYDATDGRALRVLVDNEKAGTAYTA